MAEKKAALKGIIITAAVAVILVVVWLMVKPGFWAKRGIDPTLYENQGLTAYEWLEENIAAKETPIQEGSNWNNTEYSKKYEYDALKEYLPSCNTVFPLSIYRVERADESFWEMNYIYESNQSVWLYYYDNGKIEKTVYFRALYFAGLTPHIKTVIRPAAGN